MRELFRQYIIRLYQDIPTEVYEGLLSIFCIGVVGFIVFYGWKSGWRNIAWLLLTEYVFLIYCSTVICRETSEGIVGHDFHPLWSYKAFIEGKEELLPENIMNVIVFIPVGIILGSLLRGKGSWLIGLIAILIISCSIEALQYFLKRGLL